MKSLLCVLLLSSCSLQVCVEPVPVNKRVGYKIKANVAILAKSDYHDTDGFRTGDSTAGKVVFPFVGQILKFFGL